MFDILIASGKFKGQRPVGGAVASMVAHGAVVTAALLASRPAVRVATEFEERIAEYLFPKDRAPTTGTEKLSYLRALGGSEPAPSVGAKGNEAGREPLTKPHDPETLQLHEIEGGKAAAPDLVSQQAAVAQSMGAFILLDVDSAAVRDPRSAAPSYPKDLEAKGVEGIVRVRFVVDSTGFIDLSTVRVLEKTNDEFVAAVRTAMPQMRFRPAYMGEKPVRQLSEQDFAFRVRRVAPGASARKPPTR